MTRPRPARRGGPRRRPADRRVDPPAVERVGTVAALGHRGDGLVPAADGQPDAHVAGVLPGETVRIRQSGDRGALLEVLAPSPARVSAPCPHFGRCGGCQLQHLSPAAYDAFKHGLVVDALAARGLALPALEVVTVPAASRRRAVLAAVRTRGGVVLGFNERRGHVVVPVDACLVLSPRLGAALPTLRALAAAALLPGESAAVTVVDAGTGLDVSVATGPRGPTGARPDPAAVAAAAEAFGSNGAPPLLRLSRDGELLFQTEAPAIAIDGALVPLPPGAFLQASAEAEAAMARPVAAAADGARRIADLFCGIGTFALPLSRIAPVRAVDADPALTAALAAARRAPGQRAIEVETRDLMAFPPPAGELSRFDVVVFDPPRAGARTLAAELARASVPRIVAVSCNPATLARDLATLVGGGFEITQVTAVDQFVFSAHIEIVAVLDRRDRP